MPGPQVEHIRPDRGRAGVARGPHDIGHSGRIVGQAGQDRRHADARVDPRVDESAKGPQALSRRRGPGLGQSPDPRVQGRDRERHPDLRPFAGERQDIQIADDHRAAGDEPDRRACLAERLDRAARQAEPALGRLVRVGRRPDDHLVALPRPAGELSPEHLDEVRLDPDRGAVAGIRWPIRQSLEGTDEAERALMGAAHVRVQRPLERHVPHAGQRATAGFVAILGTHRGRIEQMF